MKTKIAAILALAFSTSLNIELNSSAFAAQSVAPRESSSATGGKSRKVFKGKIERDVMMADDLMLKRKYAEAADLYRQAISRNAKNVQAIVGLGTALGKQFKLDAADEQFDKALALDSGNAAAHSGKAVVLLNRLQSSSFTVIKNRDSILKQAESECQQSLSRDPYNPEAHYNLGQVYKEQGKLMEASAEFNEAIKSDPSYSDAYAGLGMAKLQTNSFAEAEENFKRAVSLNSGNSTAHFGLGKTYVRQGRFDDAIKELNTSLYQNPNSAPARQALGEAYEGQGNTVAAIKEYQESLRIKPENSEPYLHIADIREQRGDIELSMAELRSGLELMPDNTDLRLHVADDSLRLEKLDDAIKEYQAILAKDPQNSAAAKGLTRGYYLKAQKDATGAFVVSNEFERADSMIAQAIQMNPNDMELRLAQAKLNAMSGKPVDLKTIGTPTNDGERVAFAEALLAQDRFQEASDQMRMVINAAPDAKQTFAVADLSLMIKDLDDAEAAYKKAAMMPGGQERANRGLAAVAKARDGVRQDLTLADDLARKKQLASALDKYHSAIFNNPTQADARIGAAKTLERLSPPNSRDIREAITQYKAYMSLTPNMPEKEKQKMAKKLTSLDQKAYKLEQKEAKTKRGY
jgi:tetratricopeptide (TPR) repeat protein